ncbi:MalY/PatB family protein [Microbacterium halotolerans]|uniref:MalY/PatB family protein n=1 Tax=Microbacterium halotolerans TaxID=246613 RepID=UPI000E6AB95F|nr:aminotransferase class I/II-fold pyridoxal phosphate-dependent enzyme [Microbacterium halotolerans]
MTTALFDTSTFDSISAEDLRATGSLKWTMFPGKTPAFVAEMDFGIAPPITRALHTAVDVGAFGYLPPASATAMSDSFVDWAASRYGWRVSPDDVKPMPDVIAALELAIDHFSAPGSAVVLPTPAYMPFLTVPEAHDRRIIQVPMIRTQDGWEYDLAGIDRAFSDGGGLLILCNPHNPIGRVLRHDEMVAIGDVVERHGARVFSDEIHAPLVYDGAAHVPYAAVNDVNAGHTITATSASKAWNLPGMKCAQVVLSNEADRAYWAEHGRSFGHGVANLGVIANTAAYSAGGQWLDGVLSYLDGNRHLLADLLDEHLPGVEYTAPEGTYLAWLECGPLGIEGSPADFFAEHAEVVTTDGSMCGDGYETAIRFNFAMPRPILRATVAAMGAAVRKLS